MERIDQYPLFEPKLMRNAAPLWESLRYIAQRVLAILAVLGMIYGLVAAEVELAQIEQISEPVPR